MRPLKNEPGGKVGGIEDATAQRCEPPHLVKGGLPELSIVGSKAHSSYADANTVPGRKG